MEKPLRSNWCPPMLLIISIQMVSFNSTYATPPMGILLADKIRASSHAMLTRLISFYYFHMNPLSKVLVSRCTCCTVQGQSLILQASHISTQKGYKPILFWRQTCPQPNCRHQTSVLSIYSLKVRPTTQAIQLKLFFFLRSSKHIIHLYFVIKVAFVQGPFLRRRGHLRQKTCNIYSGAHL